MKRIGIYCDVSNLYYCIRAKYQTKLDYRKLYEFCSGYGQVCKAKAYGAQIGNQAEGFIAALQKAGYETEYKAPKTYNRGSQNQQSKADHDVTIAVDVIKDCEDLKLELVILGSADGDFLPVLKYLLAKEIEVVVMGCGISHELEIATQVIEMPPMVML